MNPERSIATPEMIELKRLQKQREEDEEEKERVREFSRETEQRERPNRQGRLKVAEWCFLNFRFFEETAQEPNERSEEKPRALIELRHFIRTGGLVEGTLLFVSDIQASRRLLSIYQRIAKHCPSPFTEEELIDWRLVEQPDLIISDEQVMQSNLAVLEAVTDQELIKITLEELVELLTLTGAPDRNLDWIAFSKWKKRLSPEHWEELWSKIQHCSSLALEVGADGYDEIQKRLDEKRANGESHEAIEKWFEADTKERVLIKLRAKAIVIGFPSRGGSHDRR